MQTNGDGYKIRIDISGQIISVEHSGKVIALDQKVESNGRFGVNAGQRGRVIRIASPFEGIRHRSKDIIGVQFVEGLLWMKFAELSGFEAKEEQGVA